MPDARYRVAMVCSHAIQYFMPWFRSLSQHPRIALTVLLGDDHGLKGASYDPGFGRAVLWDIPLLEGVPAEILKNHAPNKGVGRFLGILPLGLLTTLSHKRFDAVVIQGWNYALYPLALAASRLHGIPVLLRGESPLLAGDPHPANDRSPKGRLKRLVLSSYLGMCAGALSVSSGNRRLLAAYGVREDRIFHSPYAVDGSRFALGEEERKRARATLRAELSLKEDIPLLLFVGKLQPIKDPGLLLSAYAELRRAGYRAALAFCGDGELMADLRSQISQDKIPDVHFLGFRNQTELPQVYAAADIFVLPSVRETFGLVVNEAMHAGLPVVCSDGVGCAEDLITRAKEPTGRIFKRGQQPKGLDARQSLQQALIELVEDPARRVAMGQEAQRHIHTWTFAEATSGLLQALDVVVPKRRATCP